MYFFLNFNSRQSFPESDSKDNLLREQLRIISENNLSTLFKEAIGWRTEQLDQTIRISQIKNKNVTELKKDLKHSI